MMKDTLMKLLSVYGPTGAETKVADVIAEMIRPFVDEIRTDALGNLICVRHGREGGKRVMFSAHMDHIGLVVTDADEHGFLRVFNVGGVRAERSIGEQVVFQNGVHGVIGVDGSADKPEMKDLFIDIGADSREEALAMVSLGDVAVYQPSCVELGRNRLSAPAMDNRAGCAVLLEAMMQLGETDNEIAAVFSVQEEVGLRGAKTAAFAVDPDLGIALDLTLTGDIPEARPRMTVKLGGGAAVKVMDRSVICAPVVRDKLVALAEEKQIAYQMEVLTAGGTDAGAMHVSRGGVPSGVISIPCRYVHSNAETIDVRDAEAAAKLLAAYAEAAL